jgi:transcriptional regulator with XRE-family HTH domain
MRESNEMTAYDVVRLSGNKISVGTVWNVLNERVRNITTETLQAFARALKVSEDELFEIAYGRPRRAGEDPNELRLLIWYRNLPPERQADVMLIAGALHRQHAAKPAEKVAKLERSTKRKNAA